MFKVAICDDEPSICAQVKGMLQGHSYYEKMQIEAFYSGEDLFEAFQQKRIDLVILDIELPGINGIDLAKSLTTLESVPQFIFISGKTAYCLQLFTFQPIDFLPKPINKARLLQAVDQAVRRYEEDHRMFLAQSNKAIIQIPYTDIIYFEAKDKQVEIHTAGDVYSSYGALSRIVPTLPLHFLMTHQSYIVNLEYVRIIRAEKLFLQDGTVLPIGRTYHKQVKDFFSKMIKENF